MVIDIIAIHASKKAARRSGVFGLLGDEPIQVVDPSDLRWLKEYSDFMQEAMEAGRNQGRSNLQWFDAAFKQEFYRQLLAWVREAETREI